MKRTALMTGLFLPGIILYGQKNDTLTLDFCYRQAEMTYPLAKQTGLLGQSSDLRIRNIKKNWLPQVNLNGNASLQSEVTQVDIALPGNLPDLGMPELSKDWYKVTLDVNQAVYEGHITFYQKKLESYNLQADQVSVRIELYKLKERINQYYFNILILQESKRQLQTTKEQLEAKLKEVESAVANGVMLASNKDALSVELIRIDQLMTEIDLDRSAAFSILSELTSTPIPESAFLVMPQVQLSSFAYENKRLEIQLFDIQQDRSGIQKNMVTTKWNPKFYAYGQAGYGRPGLNFLSNDFSPWWIVGAKLTWNFWNWNQNRNEKKIYDLQKELIGTQKETFDKNTRMETDRQIAEILKLTELLKKDEEIIDLRIRITRSASSQLDNGVITSSDYISRLTEETMARLAMEVHRIQLVRARLSYLFTVGKL
jgi:outer membrane protein TolC